MPMTSKQHIDRLDALKALRADAEDTWRESLDLTYPERAVLIGTDVTPVGVHSSAKATRSRINDSTASYSTGILASAVQSGAFPSSSRWVGLTVNGMDNNTVVHKALDNAAEILWKNIHASNFDSVMSEALVDLVAAGMFGIYITDGEKGSGQALHFELWPLHSLYCTDSTGRGFIDTVYRSFTLTAEQAISEYGEEVGENIKKAVEKNPDEIFDFVQAICPRKKEDMRGEGKLDLAIMSVHIQIKGQKIVREAGYEEMPVVVPRWRGVPGSEYGIGQVSTILPDAKTLNKLIELGFGSVEMSICGMYGAVDDGIVNAKTIKVGARKVIVMASKDNFFPIPASGKPDFAIFEIERLQSSIKKGLLADQLQPQDGPAMTATEVHVRIQLLRQILAPVSGRFKTEFEPAIARCFNLLYRRGAFNVLPEELTGENAPAIIPTYSSPLAKAQKLEDVGAMERFEDTLLKKASAGITDPLDIYDQDKATRELASLLGVPASLLKDKDVVDEDRAARQDAEQASLAAERKHELLKGAIPPAVSEGMKSGNMGDMADMAGAGLE